MTLVTKQNDVISIVPLHGLRHYKYMSQGQCHCKIVMHHWTIVPKFIILIDLHISFASLSRIHMLVVTMMLILMKYNRLVTF